MVVLSFFVLRNGMLGSARRSLKWKKGRRCLLPVLGKLDNTFGSQEGFELVIVGGAERNQRQAQIQLEFAHQRECRLDRDGVGFDKHHPGKGRQLEMQLLRLGQVTCKPRPTHVAHLVRQNI